MAMRHHLAGLGVAGAKGSQELPGPSARHWASDGLDCGELIGLASRGDADFHGFIHEESAARDRGRFHRRLFLLSASYFAIVDHAWAEIGFHGSKELSYSGRQFNLTQPVQKQFSGFSPPSA
jgi:hypothetical protein